MVGAIPLSLTVGLRGPGKDTVWDAVGASRPEHKFRRETLKDISPLAAFSLLIYRKLKFHPQQPKKILFYIHCA